MGLAITPRGDMLKYRVLPIQWTHHACLQFALIR